MMATKSLRGVEEGSLPLVLLAAIILAGIIVALFTTVFTGTQSAQFDRDFSQAFQIADAGIQQSFGQLLAIDPDALDDPSHPAYDEDPCGDGEATAGSNSQSGECTMILAEGSSDASTFTWTYERVGDLRQWEVRSQGTFLGTSRAVKASVGSGPLFSGALMSDDDTQWAGGGATVTGGECNIEPFPVDSEGPAWIDPTGPCVSQLTLWGIDRVITSDDKIETYLDDTYPDDHEKAGEPKQVIFPGTPLDLVNIGERAFQADSTETFPDGGPCADEDPTSVPSELERGVVYCFSDFIAGPNSTITVVDGDGGDSESPVIAYVQNNVDFRTNSDVNFSPVEDTRAVDLQIYAGGTKVTVQGTAEVKAAIWAPAASCHSKGGPGAFHGAMACFDIRLSGNFFYDPSVQEIQGSTFNISRYSEEFPS